MPNRFFDLFNETDKDRVIDVDVDNIQPSRYQPRLIFDEEALQELAVSIRQNGLIQPITVRKVDDHYEIIAGERRYRACLLLQMEKVEILMLKEIQQLAEKILKLAGKI